MALVALKSTAVTNADATPVVINNPAASAGMLRAVAATLENTASDSVGSTYRMVRVPSNARIHRVIYAADAAGATGQVDVGVYQTAENGGAVVDADHFASALDPGAGAVASTDVTHESGVYGIDDVVKPLWEALGLSSDPKRDYDIVLTVVEIMADAGTQMLKVEYVI
jgi:hypothetical protein